MSEEEQEEMMEWVNKVSSEALIILQQGLMRGISTMLETRNAMGGDRMSVESLWYATLLLEFIARSAVRDGGLTTQKQLDLMKASKVIGTKVYERVRLGEVVSDEGIKSMEDIISEMGARLNMTDVGEA